MPVPKGSSNRLKIQAARTLRFTVSTQSRLNWNVAATLRRSLSVNTTWAAFQTAFVPLPTANPKSAYSNAGASLSPSPTTATTSPPLRKVCTSCALWVGSSSAATRSAPDSLPKYKPARLLSPVMTEVVIPMSFRRRMASGVSSRNSSEKPKIAYNVRPTLKYHTVFPASESCSTYAFVSAGIRAYRPTNSSEPIRIFSRKQRAVCHPSGVERISVQTGRRQPSAASRTAAASGISLSCSIAAAIPRIPVSEPLWKIWMSDNTGRPIVRVPVLSKMTSVVSPASLNTVPSRSRIWCSAAFVTATNAAKLGASMNKAGEQHIKMDRAICHTGTADRSV